MKELIKRLEVENKIMMSEVLYQRLSDEERRLESFEDYEITAKQ